jgi:hypothetical protein
MSYDRAVYTDIPTGTAASRRTLAAIDATNGDPSAATDGAEVTGARAVSVLLWTYDAFSEEWVADEVYATESLATGTHRRWLELYGADRVYVELVSTGAAGTLSAWVRPVQF